MDKIIKLEDIVELNPKEKYPLYFDYIQQIDVGTVASKSFSVNVKYNTKLYNVYSLYKEISSL